MTRILLTVVSVGVAELPLIAREAVTVELVLPVLTGSLDTGTGLALVRLLLAELSLVARPAVTLRALTVLQAGSIVKTGTGLAPPQHNGGRGYIELTALSHRLAVLHL